MTKEKAVDVYKDEAVVADMVERYTAVVGEGFTDEDRAEVVQELADELGKPKASVIAKLVREQVYVAKTHKTKNGKMPVSKQRMVDDLIDSLGIDLTDAEATSLEKATKSALTKVQDGVNRLHDLIDMVDLEVPEDE